MLAGCAKDASSAEATAGAATASLGIAAPAGCRITFVAWAGVGFLPEEAPVGCAGLAMADAARSGVSGSVRNCFSAWVRRTAKIRNCRHSGCSLRSISAPRVGATTDAHYECAAPGTSSARRWITMVTSRPPTNIIGKIGSMP